MTGTRGEQHPIQAWKTLIGAHDFLAAVQKNSRGSDIKGAKQVSQSQELGLASIVKEGGKGTSILRSTDISAQRVIEPGILAALAIGMTVWGSLVLDPVISPPTALFDPLRILVEVQSLNPIQESLTSYSTSYESVESYCSSCKDIATEGGKQPFDPLGILPGEKTEQEKGVLAEIGQALEGKRYSYALTLFAGALVLSILLSSVSKSS